MALPKNIRDEVEAAGELDSASGIWRRSTAPSRALHDARNLVFALKATLVWLDEMCNSDDARDEIREGVEDLSAVAERLDTLLTEALGSGGRS